MLLELVLSSAFVCVIRGDSFPSLLTTNATLAVIIDREFLSNEYEVIKHAIESYLVFAKREILKHGGVNVQYYSWTTINIKKDVTAIFSIASCPDTWRLFRQARDANLLHMAISESDCPRLPPDEAITVPLITRGEELPQLLLDLRTRQTYNWNSAFILYDDTLSRDQVTRVVKSITAQYSNLRVNAAAISFVKLETRLPMDEIRRQVKEILSSVSIKTVGGNFLAIIGYELVELLMEYAKMFGLVNTRTQWLYIISNTHFRHKDINRFRQLLSEGDNIAFLYNNTVNNDTCTGGIQCHCEEILSGFTRALDEAILFEWETSSQVSDEEWEAIRPSKLDRRNSLLQGIKTFLLQRGQCDNCTSWLMKTGDTWGREYQQNGTDSGGLISVGNWRPSDGPSMSDELFPHIVHGFRKRNLPIVTFHNPPWQIIRSNESGAVSEYAGVIFELIKELSKNLNFTYTVELAKIGQEFSANLTKNEAQVVTNFIPDSILDMIRNKSVAFGACAFTVTEESKRLINFTSPISTQTYTFLVSRPRELSRALLFMSPFTGDTWLCLSASIVSMGPILYYIHKYSPVYEYKGLSKRGLSSVQNCIWYMYGALLQQGGMHLPQADSARIIVGAWWLVVLVLATTYCGNLVAFLTFPKIDIPITTIDELLAHSGTVTWSMPKGSYLERTLKYTTEPRFRYLFDKKVEVGNFKNMIEDIENGKHVHIDWKIKLQYIMKQQYLDSDRCDLALGLDEFLNEQLAMVVSQDTPYLEIINDEIKKLHQVGLIQKWLTDYLPKKDRCWKNNRHIVEVNNHTVNMDDMQGSFFVLFLGFLLSFFITIGEKLWHKYVTKKKMKIIQPFTT
ncbi:ionotropic receptor 93a isoform X1 [Tribolium castaneum]|uniref:ionotropic receptor 93a isoform X1 n=2 Tax=Tribolium castaneum TaxID=7070 RepID=UPI0001757EA0|nr:PREDICTED: glutamate receptor ionotropic, kainate 1 [Tribolium castaneum]|eukprot:XP_015840718.1 PREDICTED: glutamate receptor ionotropic, kainate 1 [Tribolium castaneum]